jgi:hypothetical protein
MTLRYIFCHVVMIIFLSFIALSISGIEHFSVQVNIGWVDIDPNIAVTIHKLGASESLLPVRLCTSELII